MDCYCRWKHWKRQPFCAVIICSFCFCLIIHGICITDRKLKSSSENSCGLIPEGDNYFQKSEKIEIAAAEDGEGAVKGRVLVQLGSSPPRCASKCGRCSPCKAVHVPVPPGNNPVTMEYYPEAWRCKCGNTLHIP